jgi:hypothetical protein
VTTSGFFQLAGLWVRREDEARHIQPRCQSSGDKRRQPVAAGGLPHRLTAQIEAPADSIAQVAQRGVHREAVHEQGTASLHLELLS